MLLQDRKRAVILLVVATLVARAEAGNLKWDLSTDDTRISISVPNNQPSVTYLGDSGFARLVESGAKDPLERER